MILRNVKKREKEYLEELIKPLNIKYDYIDSEFKEKKNYKDIIKQQKNYFIATLSILIGILGITTSAYINNYNLILEQDRESDIRYEKQLEFNYNIMKKIDENQNHIKNYLLK